MTTKIKTAWLALVLLLALSTPAAAQAKTRDRGVGPDATGSPPAAQRGLVAVVADPQLGGDKTCERSTPPIHEIGDNHLAGDQEPLDLFAEERRVAFDVVEGQVSVVEAIDARQRLRVGDDEPLRASHAGRAEDLRDVLAVVPGVERRPLAGKRRERKEEMTVVRSRTHVPHLSLERIWVPQGASRIAAIPCPPPMHMVSRARRPPRRRNSCNIVVMMRTPVAPTG